MKQEQWPGSAPGRGTVLALYAAAAVPLIYFGTQLVAAPFFPGYSFAQNTASELGTTTSRHPGVFNTGAMLTGVAALAGAPGMFRALRRITRTTLALLVAVTLVANGVLSVKAGLFPMPDPRHASWQFLQFPMLAAPLLLFVAMWRQGPALRTYFILNAIALCAMMPLLMHRIAPIFAEGTTQRLLALAVFVPIGVAAWVLVRQAQNDF